MYSAIVLDNPSREKLVKWLRDHFPHVKRENWEIVAHHMTIKMGPLPEYLFADKGTEQTLEVIGVGNSEMTVAVRVVGYFSENKVPHITLAVNRAAGGKPVMSNDIKNWQSILSPFKVKGTVEEIK